MTTGADTSNTIFNTFLRDNEASLIFAFAHTFFKNNLQATKLDKNHITKMDVAFIDAFLEEHKEDIQDKEQLRDLFDKHSIFKLQEEDGTHDLVLVASNAVYKPELGRSVHVGEGNQGKVKQALSEKHGLVAFKTQECYGDNFDVEAAEDADEDFDLGHIDEIKNEAKITAEVYGLGAHAVRTLKSDEPSYTLTNAQETNEDADSDIEESLEPFVYDNDSEDDDDVVVFVRETDGDSDEEEYADDFDSDNDEDQAQDVTYKYYFTMPLLPGKPLDKAMAELMQGANAEAKNLILMLTLLASAQALNDIHAKGIIHADIKPGNILIHINKNRMLSAKIIDFGLAQKLSNSSEPKKLGDMIIEQVVHKGIPAVKLADEQGEKIEHGTQDYYYCGRFGRDLLSDQMAVNRGDLAKEKGPRANEVKQGIYSQATDIFALGRIGLQVMAEQKNMDNMDELLALFNKMTDMDPSQRPTATATVTELSELLYSYYASHEALFKLENIYESAKKMVEGGPRPNMLIAFGSGVARSDFKDIEKYNDHIVRKINVLIEELEPQPLKDKTQSTKSRFGELKSDQKTDLKRLLQQFVDEQQFASGTNKIRLKDLEELFEPNNTLRDVPAVKTALKNIFRIPRRDTKIARRK